MRSLRITRNIIDRRTFDCRLAFSAAVRFLSSSDCLNHRGAEDAEIRRDRFELPQLFLPVGVILVAFLTANAQSPTPTPDSRGLGVQSSASQSNSQTGQQAREAKPELVLQTGYNNFYGATRSVFSPDGKLLATGTYHSNTIKLWETATGRELRDLSTGTQSSQMLAPTIAFSRDSHLIAAASGNNVVKVWDVISGRELQSLAGPQGSLSAAFGVYFIGFTNNNQVISMSDAIRVWDPTTGQALRTFELNTSDMSGFSGTDGGIALTPDGTQLAVFEIDSRPQIKFVDLTTGKEARKLNLPDKDIRTVQLSFAADGHLQVAAVVDKHLKMWDLGPKDNERDLGPTQKEYPQVKFSPDGRLLSVSENYIVKAFDVASGKEIINFKAPNTGLFPTQGEAFVAFSSDSKRFATGGFDTPTIIWDSENAKQLVKMSGRTNMAFNVSFSPDGNRLWSGGRTVWDLRTGRGLRVSANPASFGTPSPDGKLLAVYNPTNEIIEIVEAPSGNKLVTINPGNKSIVSQHVHFSADSSMLVVVYGEAFDTSPKTYTGPPKGIIKIWDVKSGRQLQSLEMNEIAGDASFSADGRTLATIGHQGEISLWEVSSGNKIRDLRTSPMSNLTSPGSIMNPATMGNIRRGQMPSMPDMSQISEMMNNTLGTMSAGTAGRTVTSVTFSPDGRTLATGGVESKSNFDMAAMINSAMNQGKKPKKNQQTPDPDDIMKNYKVEAVGQVQLWDVATGQLMASLKGHGKGVSQVAFSRDGRLLASASTDNTIKIWDAKSGSELRTLVGHTASIDSIDFSPDGRLIASAAEDGGTFLWDANSGEHLLTLISLDDGAEWMVVTPQGLFDGTPVSWNQILWRYNHDTFNVAPIEWFFNEFYYPGLLGDVVGGKRPKVSQDISRKDRRQPVVKLTTNGETSPNGVTSRTIKVRIEVTDAPADKEHSGGCGARDVRLFRNGSLVKVWHGDVLKGQQSVTLEQEITVTAGPNRLVAYAFNNDNVKSKDAPLSFDGADALKRKGTAYILAVGVNQYANDQYNLKYAVADAQDFGDEVRLRQSQVGSFDRVEVIQLLNEDATKANIIGVLKRMVGVATTPTLKAGPLDNIKRVEPEDTVIIYFAGHGTAQQQRFYLIPHDLGYTGERDKLTEEGLKTILSHSVSDLELEEAVEGLDAGHLVLVIDACNSGQALEAEEKRRGPMNSKGLAQLAYEKGMYILTAAQSFQAALEAAQLGHGLLTYALVEEGLKTSAADTEPKDGVVSAREWLDFATLRVPQMQEEKMKQSRGVGIEISFTEGEKDTEPDKRSVQRPRVFYRRELEATPLIIAKP